MKTKRGILAIAAVGLVALGASACGGDDAVDSADAATSAAAAAGSSVAAAASTATAAASSAADAASSAVDAATSAAAPATSAAAGAPDLGSLSGAIVIDGSSTVEPIMSAVAEEFQKAAPGTQVSVGTSGTGGGFEKFCAGETDISDASRGIKDEEAAACAAAGIEYVELQVGSDGITIVTNPENDWATCLTVDQLKAMWEPSSTAKSWKDIDPSFPDEALTLYGPGTDSGTFDFFTDKVNGEEGASRTDYTPSEDDNVIVQGVEGDKGALGYFGIAYYEANADQLKALEVDGGSGCVAPSKDTVRDGSYAPLSRPLFFYVKKEAAMRPEIQGLVSFIFDNAETVVDEVGYVAPTADDIQKDRDAFAAFIGG